MNTYLKVVLVSSISLLISLTGAAQQPWKAKWISYGSSQNASNSWFCFRKMFPVETVPTKAIAKIAVDSKYWLWINGKLVVFEGGLKRGPTPNDTYYDEVDITPYLEKGENIVSILQWYFGKDGYSHKSSGEAGLLFECIAPGLELLSDKTWKGVQNTAYETLGNPLPNYRLSESSLHFDARYDVGNWRDKSYKESWLWQASREFGVPPVAPWNNLVLRPIPQWKNSGLLAYTRQSTVSSATADTITCEVPANIHFTPYLKVDAPAGLTIKMQTDLYSADFIPNANRAEYVTRNGEQEYESYAWLNGQKLLYIIPKGVNVVELSYRETGFNTEFAGNFTSSDAFLNRLWQKARRTVYVNMRDSYMDCPDRERGQWWGDEVNESGQAFYAFDPKSHSLMRKGMYELIGWQRKDSTLFSPIPAGNWSVELPPQILLTVGPYGFWNYYLQTGDKQPIADLYTGVRKYLSIWKTNDKGTLICRPGEWAWVDWGGDIDLEPDYNALYYMALKTAANMAALLGKSADEAEYSQKMKQLKTAFNQHFWTGTLYRDPAYKGKDDDRCQALAVLSGLADSIKYPLLFAVLQKEEHATSYFENYVLEALFQMGYADYALERMKKRFGNMVNDAYSTLPEGFDGRGSKNHGWSGGGLTVLSQSMCGIAPLEPGYTRFQILPRPGSVEQASATVSCIKGEIKSAFINKAGKFDLTITVPVGTQAIVGIPDNKPSQVTMGGKTIWKNGKFSGSTSNVNYLGISDGFLKFKVSAGNWALSATKNTESVKITKQ